MKSIITSILVLVVSLSFSQNNLYIGTKSYPATRTWGFLFANEYNNWTDNSLGISVAKKNDGSGLFVVSAHSIFSNESISGLIILYLDNGETISLATRVSKDFSDDYITSIYSLSKQQINKLKLSTIRKVRISIVSFGSKKGVTGENRMNISTDPSVYEERTTNTSEEITQLFN